MNELPQHRIDLIQRFERRVKLPLAVLVVEDNDSDFERTVHALSELDGFAVTRATSGREAIHDLLHNEYALILLDLRLPLVNGMDVLEAVQDRSRVVILTGYPSDAPNVREAMELGVSHVIIKPVTRDKLLPVFTTPYTR